MDNPQNFLSHVTSENTWHSTRGDKMCDDRFEFFSVIRGHHIYKDIFMPAIGKLLQSRREADNSYDSFAVTIIEDDTNVGHVLQEISVVCDLFLRKGTILCVVTGPCQYSRDLEKVGLM